MDQPLSEKKGRRLNHKDAASLVGRVIGIVVLLYLFLCAIGLMGAGFKALGANFARTLVQSTSNPLVGLFIGILATSLIQSSSTTTSIIVGMVSSGVLTVGNAVPMIMGANMGTTVTATLVSFSSIGRRREFERAFSAATMHDFFNIIAICIFFPIELLFHPLEKSALFLTGLLTGVGGGEFHSPVKAAVKPLVKAVQELLTNELELSLTLSGVIMIACSVGIIFVALILLVRSLRSALANKIENIIDRFIGRRGVIGIFIGFVTTAIVQSSSVTTSMVVPLVAARITSLEAGFTIVLGANLGTTVTALMASLAGERTGLSIALVHLLFNLFGILLIYPFPAIRRIPLSMARRLASLGAKSRVYAFVFVLCAFFVLPLLAIFIDKLLR